jgi:hypothetical protein
MIYSDNGGEFINNRMVDWAKKKGIVMNTTNPFAHQQNELVERRNRTLTEMAKAMMAHANMTAKDYSTYAFEAAAYLLNRRVSSRTAMTPYEGRTGDKPDLSKLRVFGCRAYVHIPKEKRTKMMIPLKKEFLWATLEMVTWCRPELVECCDHEM